MNGNTSIEGLGRRKTRNRQLKEVRVPRSRKSWAIGGIFILIGIFMLARNMNLVTIHNWWAFFILIPAFAGFGTVIYDLRSCGSLTTRGWSGFISGITLSATAAIIIFNLDWQIFGPIALILGGLAILAKNIWR